MMIIKLFIASTSVFQENKLADISRDIFIDKSNAR